MRAGVIALVLALAGCASPMVLSTTGSGEGVAGEYLGEYGLVSSTVEVTVTAQSAAAAEEKPAATPTIAFNSQITVHAGKDEDDEGAEGEGTPAEAKPAAKTAEPKPQTQASVCSDLRKSYNQDRVAGLVSIKRHLDFEARLRGWAAKPPTEAVERKAVKSAIDEFLVQRAGDKAALVRAETLISLMAYCPQVLKVVLKEVVETDPSVTYRLYGAKALMADNQIATEFENGLIKSVNATSEDQTGAIAEAAGKAIGMFTAQGPGLGVRSGQVLTSAKMGDLGEPAVKIADEDYSAAALEAMADRVHAEAKKLLGAPLDKIDADLPMKKVYTLAQLTKTGGLILAVTPEIHLSTDCSKPATTAAEKSYTFQDDDKPLNQPRKVQAYPGILVSATRSCTITALQDGVELSRLHFAALDAKAPALLDAQRRVFTKQTSAFAFESGRLTKSDVSRPSPISAGLAIPGRIVGGFTGAVSDGIRGRKGVIEAQTERTKADTAQLEAKTAYETAKKKAAPAPTADDASEP